MTTAFRPSSTMETPRGPSPGYQFHQQESRAFNEGCDARLRGLDRSWNPYLIRNGEAHLGRKWRDGWVDVDRYWGAVLKDPKNKLGHSRLAFLRPLPPIKPLEADPAYPWGEREQAIMEAEPEEFEALGIKLAELPDRQKE